MDYYLSIALFVVYYTIVILVFFRVLLENRNPIKTQSYLLLLVLLPVAGLIIYLFFGVNYRKEKLFSRKGIIDHELIKEWRQVYKTKLEEHVHKDLDSNNKLPLLFWRNAKATITDNNEVKILNNGEEKFPILIEQLSYARHHIHLEYYIFEEGAVWEEIKGALLTKVAEGVQVRMIYDSIGSNQIKNRTLRELRKAGIQTASYNPVLFTRFANRVNYRDHRKIVVIDGKTGFTGGINVSDRYINNGKNDLYWRDMHSMIKGDAVKGLQLQFFLNWYFTTNQLIPFDPPYFPHIDELKGTPTAIIGSQPDSDFASIMEAYYQMIHTAKREVLIATPYFVPNSSILAAIKITAKSGVKVKLLLPGKSDSFLVQAASLSYVDELMENDVEVYLYEKGMIHSKMMVVDGEVSTIGTANMDYRSFDNNAEVNAFFLDSKIGKEIRDYFYSDLEDSKRVRPEEWKTRPWRIKLVGSLGRLIAPVL